MIFIDMDMSEYVAKVSMKIIGPDLIQVATCLDHLLLAEILLKSLPREIEQKQGKSREKAQTNAKNILLTTFSFWYRTQENGGEYKCLVLVCLLPGQFDQNKKHRREEVKRLRG